MVRAMEAWLVAGRDAPRRFYGQGFNEKAFAAPSCECHLTTLAAEMAGSV